MSTTTIDVTCCRDCKFFWRTITKKMGAIPHCNFYPFLTWKFNYSKEKRHPDCKVKAIVVNEELP